MRIQGLKHGTLNIKSLGNKKQQLIEKAGEKAETDECKISHSTPEFEHFWLMGVKQFHRLSPMNGRSVFFWKETFFRKKVQKETLIYNCV